VVLLEESLAHVGNQTMNPQLSSL